MTVVVAAACGREPPPRAAPAPPPKQAESAEEPPPPAAIAHTPPSGSTSDPAPVGDGHAEAEGGSESDDGADESTGAEPEAERDPLRGEVQAGDSLSRILSRASLDAATIHRVSTAMTPLMDPATIRVGQRYSVELDAGGDLVAFTFRTGPTKSVVVAPNEAGELEASEQEVETEVREEEIGGTVESSLWGALTTRGHSPALVDVIVDTFAYDIDFFTATRKGDVFRIIVERHEVDGELVHYGKVLAAEYAGASETHRVLWWQPKGAEGRYVDGEGRGVARTLLKTPLKYARISSGFDPKRMHPVLHREKSHNGVDYAAPEGTPVWAAADGRIVHRKDAGGAGNMVILKHDGGLSTLYMHLSKFADGQSVGNKVKAKTVIGYVGSTGLATGPHLHFGVKKNGKYVDPTKVESVRSSGVPKADRKRFAKQAKDWETRLAAIEVD